MPSSRMLSVETGQRGPPVPETGDDRRAARESSLDLILRVHRCNVNLSTVGSRPKSSLNFCCASLSVTSTSTPRSVPSSASSEIARTLTVTPWRWSACTAQYFPTSPRPPCREARRHVRMLMTPSRSLRREPREAPSWRRVSLFWLPGQLSQSSIEEAKPSIACQAAGPMYQHRCNRTRPGKINNFIISIFGSWPVPPKPGFPGRAVLKDSRLEQSSHPTHKGPWRLPIPSWPLTPTASCCSRSSTSRSGRCTRSTR